MWTCRQCGKPVYFAERRQSLGHDWHPACLRCAECGKVLNPGTHAEVGNIMMVSSDRCKLGCSLFSTKKSPTAMSPAMQLSSVPNYLDTGPRQKVTGESRMIKPPTDTAIEDSRLGI